MKGIPMLKFVKNTVMITSVTYSAVIMACGVMEAIEDYKFEKKLRNLRQHS